jgi:4-hydroxy-2-oxoglutarate aldolase
MTLAGVLAPVPTPFDERDRLDLPRFRAALARWLAGPLSGIVVLGSTGEEVLMDDDERLDVVRTARELVPRTKWLIAGTGRESTRSAIRAAQQAAAAGADAVLVRTPGFYKSQITGDALAAHYTAVAESSPVPVLLYQFPALTGVTMERDVVARLAAHPNIAGMKDSSGDVLRFTDYASCGSGTFAVFTGSAATFYQSLCLGAAGGILALACILPDACARLFELTRSGRHEEARGLQQALVPLA